MAPDPWEERLTGTDLAWPEQEQLAGAGYRSRRQEQAAGVGAEQEADFPFLICHFSFWNFGILEFQREDDHEERAITMKNDQ